MAPADKYPYPAHVNVANFVLLKLTTLNYLLWETQIISLIESQELVDFINGDTPMSDPEIKASDGKGKTSNPDSMSWTRTDQLVKAWITRTLSREVLCLAAGMVTAADLWRDLADAFAQNSQA